MKETMELGMSETKEVEKKQVPVLWGFQMSR